MHLQDTLVPIPVTKLEAALMEAAYPGLFGRVRLDLNLTEESVETMDILVANRFTHTITPRPQVSSGDDRRRVLIQRALHSIAQRMQRRACLLSLNCHFADGELIKYDVEHLR